MKYIYTDIKKKQIVFTCEAESMSKADQIYNKYFGVNVIKQNHIGCSHSNWPQWQ